MSSLRLALLFFFANLVPLALGDPNDWVNVEYVLSQTSSQRRPTTTDAQATIVRSADKAAGHASWSIANAKDILPPSKDSHDYLSWAPYHWPNCNWCNQAGRTHLAHSGDGPDHNSTESNPSASASLDPNDPYSNEAVMFLSPNRYPIKRVDTRILDVFPDSESGNHPASISSDLPIASVVPQLSATSATNTPTIKPSIVSAPISGITPTSDGRTHGPAQAAAKTTKASCTPSPTKSLALSATWTTCPYVGRDGQVNPDVRTLNGPDAINNVAQAVIYNAVAYGLKKSSTYSQNIVNMIQTFFVVPSTKMNPNLNFGQVVRGPGPDGISGTFTGILDLRGLVKIVNGISILKASGNSEWTSTLDKALGAWMSDYSAWLANSPIGKMTASRPNNHATFYLSQVASAKFLSGDWDGAIVDLQHFCSTTFLDQVARSGEQPFEAVRTRPYHYRNFNLEALITNAKLGDQLGIDLWTCKSKYGATIQTALDFLLVMNPGDEDISLIFPHVASVSAAYGDPTGKYAAFLKKNDPTYQSKPYWFYDQTSALRNSPASKKVARSIIWKREESLDMKIGSYLADVNVPFECPAIFRDAVKVEIDNDVFVTCDELRHFYM